MFRMDALDVKPSAALQVNITLIASV